MDAVVDELNCKLHDWKPETAEHVRVLVREIIDGADGDRLDLSRSRLSTDSVCASDNSESE